MLGHSENSSGSVSYPEGTGKDEISLEYLGPIENSSPLENMKVGNKIVIRPKKITFFENGSQVEKNNENGFEHGISIGSKGKQIVDIPLEGKDISSPHAVIIPSYSEQNRNFDFSMIDCSPNDGVYYFLDENPIFLEIGQRIGIGSDCILKIEKMYPPKLLQENISGSLMMNKNQNEDDKEDEDLTLDFGSGLKGPPPKVIPQNMIGSMRVSKNINEDKLWDEKEDDDDHTED